jgi:ABC-type multidrug transport system, ATPase and permease components
MEQIKWLLSNLKPYWALVSLVIFGSILEGLGTSFMTYLVKRIMDDVFILKESNKLYMILYLFAAAAVIIQIGFFLRNFLMNMVSEKLLMDFREKMFSSLLYSKVDFFINHPSGDIISRFNNDINSIKNILIDYMLSLIKEPITVLLLLGVLIYRDIYLTVIIIFAFPIISYSVKYFGTKRAKYVKLNQERLGIINQHVTQLISGIENIKIFGAENKFLERFVQANKNLFKAGIKTIFYTVMNSIFNQSTGYIVFGLVLLYGGYRIVHGYTSAGNFISYITALLLIQMPIMETQKGFMNMRSSIPLVKRVQEMLLLQKEKDGTIDINNLLVPIVMKNVYVTIDSKEILKDINLTINPGEKIGIVGPTGAGKSTLLDILPKLVSYKGDVYIKDKSLEDITNKSIRSKIAFASQHVFHIQRYC